MVGFIDDDRETFGVEALCRSRVAGESRGLRSSESLEAAQARRAGRGPWYGGVPDVAPGPRERDARAER